MIKERGTRTRCDSVTTCSIDVDFFDETFYFCSPRHKNKLLKKEKWKVWEGWCGGGGAVGGVVMFNI